jgi:hypothetical protein
MPQASVNSALKALDVEKPETDMEKAQNFAVQVAPLGGAVVGSFIGGPIGGALGMLAAPGLVGGTASTLKGVKMGVEEGATSAKNFGETVENSVNNRVGEKVGEKAGKAAGLVARGIGTAYLAPSYGMIRGAAKGTEFGYNALVGAKRYTEEMVFGAMPCATAGGGMAGFMALSNAPGVGAVAGLLGGFGAAGTTLNGIGSGVKTFGKTVYNEMEQSSKGTLAEAKFDKMNAKISEIKEDNEEFKKNYYAQS